MRLLRSILFTLLLVALLLPGGQTALAQESLAYLWYGADVTVRADGAFDVRLVQTVRFDDVYETAFVEIPTDRAAAVSAIQVWTVETENPLALPEEEQLRQARFSVSEESTGLFVEWEYPATEAGDIRTFVIDYTVEGGLWVYDDQDVLRWFAINADRGGVPVQAGAVTVSPPPGTPPGEVTHSVPSGNGSATVAIQAGGPQVVFRPDGPLPDGEPFEIEVGFPHGLAAAEVQAWQKEADQSAVAATVERFDATMTIRPDGTLDVSEQMEVAVESGVLYSGFRTIRLLFMDDVRDVTVGQDGRPLEQGAEGCDACFATTYTPGWGDGARADATGEVAVDEDAAGRLDIDWWVPGVARGERTSFEVRYTVAGGVRVSPADQLINWEVLPDYDTPVNAATLRIVPPSGVDARRISVESSARQSAAVQPDGSLLLTNEELPGVRARWQVAITLPPAATTAATPAWQEQFESAVAAAEEAATAAARREMRLRTGSILGIVLAALAGILAWFKWGRKRTREMLRGYVSEPPSDLAPGIVAYLVDRQASERGVLASIFQLATAGLLDVGEEAARGGEGEAAQAGGITINRRVEEPFDPLHPPKIPGEGPVRLADHQIYLYNQVVRPATPLGEPVALDRLAPLLDAKLPEVYALMGEDAQEFFLGKGAGGGCAPALAGCLSTSTLVFLWATGAVLLLFTGWPFELKALIVVLLFLLTAAAIFLPALAGGRRRSATGEAEAQKWVKFRNFLLNIQEYGDLGAAQEILDRYFAYAVALGVEEVVLARAGEMGARVPRWMPVFIPSGPSYRPDSRPDYGPRPASGAPGLPTLPPLSQPGAPAPSAPQAGGGARPSLSGMSRALGAALATTSRRMAGTLSTAAGGPAARSVTLNSALRQRQMTWQPGTAPTKMLDDIMKQSMGDVQQVRSRAEQAARAGSAQRPARTGGSSWGGGSWGGSTNWSRGGSRSTGGFGGSRSSSGGSRGFSGSRSSGSSRSSSTSRGGRSGFGRR